MAHLLHQPIAEMRPLPRGDVSNLSYQRDPRIAQSGWVRVPRTLKRWTLGHGIALVSQPVPMTIVFAHATGFCGAVWRPVIEGLSPEFTKIAWDFPAHGLGPKLPLPVDWWSFGEFARDQLADAEKPVLGVGHSMGGAALVMAEVLVPGTFAGLILIEPMLFPPPYQRFDNPLSQVVGKRRRVFESKEAARANFVSKRPFISWHPAALDGYIDDGLIETDHGVVLACVPEDEADIYRGATAHGVWERAGEVKTPSLILAGENSDTHDEARVRAIAGRLGQAGSRGGCAGYRPRRCHFHQTTER